MITRLVAFVAGIALVACSSPLVLAQGMGNSAFHSGGFGSGGFGSSSFGSGFGNSGFGSSQFGGGGFGGGGFGSSGFGSSGFGNSGFGSSFGRSGNSSFGNSGFGNQSFGSGQYGGGQNFVGRDAADMQATFSQMGRAGAQYFNSMNRAMNHSNRRQRQTATTTQNPPQPMRVEVHVAFSTPQLAPSQLAEGIRTRLTKILADHHMSQPILTLQGDTAVISGVAASEDERAVIEQLISLEPGVRAVQNEMTVALPFSAAVAPAPGS